MAGATTKVPLGASTTNRKWYLDVYPEGTTAATLDTATPIGVFGITEFKDAISPSLQDDGDFDSDGWKSQTNSANAWGIEFKVARKTKASDPTKYDEGQEIIRKTSRKTGVGNRVYCRWYEMEPGGPRVEAYRGQAVASWSPDGGNMEALSSVSVTLTGRGAPEEIDHPEAGAEG